MSMGKGWIGTTHHVMHVLATVKADRDGTDGPFHVFGEPPSSFLGIGDEVCIGEETEYAVNGNRANLATLMRSTSYGTGIAVLC